MENILATGKLPAPLLTRLVADYASGEDAAVIVGPGRGRDAAAIAFGGGTLAVKSDPITFASDRAAAYVVDVNANDLACLGATPRWLLVTMLLPAGSTTEADVEGQFRELGAICRQRKIALVGGHCEITAAVNNPVLVGALFGEVPAGKLIRPGGAQPGNRLLVTKQIAIEGTALLARELGDRLRPTLGDVLVERAANFLTDPGISVVRDATVLTAAGGITALHDPTEGGLAVGIREMADAAGRGATVNLAAIPILPETAAIANALGLEPLGLLASGTLLAAAEPEAVPAIIAAGEAAGIRVTDVGEVTADAGHYWLTTESGTVPLPDFTSDEVTRVL